MAGAVAADASNHGTAAAGVCCLWLLVEISDETEDAVVPGVSFSLGSITSNEGLIYPERTDLRREECGLCSANGTNGRSAAPTKGIVSMCCMLPSPQSAMAPVALWGLPDCNFHESLPVALWGVPITMGIAFLCFFQARIGLALLAENLGNPNAMAHRSSTKILADCTLCRLIEKAAN